MVWERSKVRFLAAAPLNTQNMSQHPNVYVSASFFVGVDNYYDNDEYPVNSLREKIDNGENGYEWLTSIDEDSGIDGNFEDGYITVYTYITYGWSDSVSPEEFKDKWDRFVNDVDQFCVVNNYGNPSFRLGADFC